MLLKGFVDASYGVAYLAEHEHMLGSRFMFLGMAKAIYLLQPLFHANGKKSAAAIIIHKHFPSAKANLVTACLRVKLQQQLKTLLLTAAVSALLQRLHVITWIAFQVTPSETSTEDQSDGT